MKKISLTDLKNNPHLIPKFEKNISHPFKIFLIKYNYSYIWLFTKKTNAMFKTYFSNYQFLLDYIITGGELNPEMIRWCLNQYPESISLFRQKHKHCWIALKRNPNVYRYIRRPSRSMIMYVIKKGVNLDQLDIYLKHLPNKYHLSNIRTYLKLKRF